MTHWSLQDAKAHLSQLVKKAQESGPQYISMQDDSVVVVSKKRI
jgi:prevent-host-death family protein